MAERILERGGGKAVRIRLRRGLQAGKAGAGRLRRTAGRSFGRVAGRASVSFDGRQLAIMWLVLMLVAAFTAAAVIAWRDRSGFAGGAADGMPHAGPRAGMAAPQAEALPITFPIYLTREQRIASVTLEQYVRGVVAAEMPIEFELEALKAQAIAARTYIARRLDRQDVSNMPVAGAWVTDTEAHQAYLTDEAIEAKWPGPEREANLAKLDRAVRETQNLIMTHEGEPILAVYFSTSNGYTENSEDYWSEKLPYLRSVESRWDRDVSPKYRADIRLPKETFAEKLGIDGKKADQIRVLERSEGRRIKKIRIGGKTFTGREVREKLGLPSTAFTIRMDGGDAVIAAYGHGHGVGMSQYGAQGMALAGYKAEEILRHYYTGITIESYQGPDPVLAAGRAAAEAGK